VDQEGLIMRNVGVRRSVPLFNQSHGHSSVPAEISDDGARSVGPEQGSSLIGGRSRSLRRTAPFQIAAGTAAHRLWLENWLCIGTAGAFVMWQINFRQVSRLHRATGLLSSAASTSANDPAAGESKGRISVDLALAIVSSVTRCMWDDNCWPAVFSGMTVPGPFIASAGNAETA
jgi:hypothetical protein